MIALRDTDGSLIKASSEPPKPSIGPADDVQSTSSAGGFMRGPISGLVIQHFNTSQFGPPLLKRPPTVFLGRLLKDQANDGRHLCMNRHALRIIRNRGKLKEVSNSQFAGIPIVGGRRGTHRFKRIQQCSTLQWAQAVLSFLSNQF